MSSKAEFIPQSSSEDTDEYIDKGVDEDIQNALKELKLDIDKLTKNPAARNLSIEKVKSLNSGYSKIYEDFKTKMAAVHHTKYLTEIGNYVKKVYNELKRPQLIPGTIGQEIFGDVLAIRSEDSSNISRYCNPLVANSIRFHPDSKTGVAKCDSHVILLHGGRRLILVLDKGARDENGNDNTTARIFIQGNFPKASFRGIPQTVINWLNEHGITSAEVLAYYDSNGTVYQRVLLKMSAVNTIPISSVLPDSGERTSTSYGSDNTTTLVFGSVAIVLVVLFLILLFRRK